MKPSACSTSRTRTRWREFGDVTLAMPRTWPFLMRASRSPMGSVIAIFFSLPARLRHARYLAEIGKFPQRDARQFQLAIVALRPARQFAAMVNACLRRIARKLRKLQPRVEPLFGGDVHVFRLGLQRGAPGGILRHQLFALGIPVDLALLRHSLSLQFMNGNWKP